MTAGLGGGAGLEVGGSFAVLGALTHQRGPHRIVLRLLVMADFYGFPDVSAETDEVALLYGRSLAGSGSQSAILAGLSVVTVHGGPESDFVQRTTLGIPLVVEGLLRGKVTGVGLQAFANLNIEAPYAGLGLLLQVGWLP
ncbi:MAG: hypothetical protein ACR2QM_18045 [Longimicrobiales bacterium]